MTSAQTVSVTAHVTGYTGKTDHGLTTFQIPTQYKSGRAKYNGPSWVVVPEGETATVTRSPGAKTINGVTANGMEKNPQRRQGAVGYDNWEGEESGLLAGDMSLNVGDSTTVQAGDILVAPVSLDTRPTKAREGIFDGPVATLFVLKEEPGEDWRPSCAFGWTGREYHPGYNVDVAAKVAALTTYDMTGITLRSYDDIVETLAFNPLFAISGDVIDYQAYSPTQIKANNSNNWGGYYVDSIDQALLALMADAGYTSAEKEHIASLLLDLGIQWYDSWAKYEFSGTTDPVDIVNANGGHFQFHLAAMATALNWTGRDSLRATLLDDVGMNFNQAFQFTAAQAAKCVPHTNSSDPFKYRHREVLAVDGDGLGADVSASRLDGDRAWFTTPGHIITRVSDGATVTATGPTDAQQVENDTVSIRVEFDAAFSPALVAGEFVWYDHPHTPVTGDYEWIINGILQFSKYDQRPTTFYRDVMAWTGQVFFLTAQGLFHENWDAVRGYTIRVNSADEPIVGNEFISADSANVAAVWNAYAASLGLT